MLPDWRGHSLVRSPVRNTHLKETVVNSRTGELSIVAIWAENMGSRDSPRLLLGILTVVVGSNRKEEVLCWAARGIVVPAHHQLMPGVPCQVIPSCTFFSWR